MKRFKKIALIVLAGMYAFTILGVAMEANTVEAATKKAEKYTNYYSWVGLYIFKTGVLGYYDTKSSKIKSYGAIHAKPSTGIAWSSSNNKAAWASKTNKTNAKATCSTKFTLGLSGNGWSLGVQSVTKSIEANGKP